MTIQTNSNVSVVIKRETTTGVAAATASGAYYIRLIGSPGLQLKRTPIVSQELRDDGNEAFGRLGHKTVDGSFEAEMTAGGATDYLAEEIMRSAFSTAVVVGFPTMTTVAIGTLTLTAAAGDWVGAQGVRVGDIFRLTNTSLAADNNINLPVISVNSLTITTVTGALAAIAATATGTITFLRKVVNATTPTRYSNSIEQTDEDTDGGELFLGARCVGMKLSCKPGEMAKVSFNFVGMDRTVLSTAISPYFTTPLLTTGLGMIADDASIVYNGAVVSTFTGIDLDFTIGATTQPVLGSFVSPDVFDNILSVKGTITGLRTDFSDLTLFDAETEFAVHLLLQELATAPKPCFGVFLPRVKLVSLAAPVGGNTGPKVVTLGLMVGPKAAATGYEATIAKFITSVAGA